MFFENKWNENSIKKIFVLINTPIWKANFISKKIDNDIEIITNIDDEIIEELEVIHTPYMFEIKNGQILKKGIIL